METPSVRLLWDARAADAVLKFLRTTRVGCIRTERVPPEDMGEDIEREEEGQGLPRMYLLFSFFLCLPFSATFLLGEGPFPLFFLIGGWGSDYDRQGRPGARKQVYKTATAVAQAAG